jgi:2-hydroxy-6-oxonona-2,4-dienedioate hydrolase
MFARASAQPATAEGRPLVLVHGVGVSSRYMVPLALRLAVDLAVYAPDLPGFGLSDKPRRPLRVPDLADALHGWLDAVGLGRVDLLGHSLGCQVTVDLAARYPERVGRLVLVAPTLEPRLRSYLQQIPRWPIALAREPISLLPILMGDYLATGPIRMFRSISLMFDDHVETKLPLVTAPTLVVRGSGDVLVSERWAEEVAARLPDGRLIVVDGGPHALHYGEPDLLAEIVRRALGEPLEPRNRQRPSGASL